MNVKLIYLLVTGAILLVGGFLFTSNRPGLPSALPPENQIQAGFFNLSFKDYYGKAISLVDYSGKPLIINTWASWCPFCKKELVDFASLQKELGNKAVIIAIDRGESPDIAKKYSDELGVTKDLIFLLDPDDSFYRTIGGFSMPETIFVDKGGVVKIHKRGSMDINEMREKAATIL